MNCLRILIALELTQLTTISPKTKEERIYDIKYNSCVAGLCRLFLDFEEDEKINYARCLVLQKIELQKDILRRFENGKPSYC